MRPKATVLLFTGIFAVERCNCFNRIFDRRIFARQAKQPTKSEYSLDALSLQAHKETKPTFSFEDSNGSSRGLVSSLTSIVNFLSGDKAEPNDFGLDDQPTSLDNLKERIGKDYTKKNYLWTGDIDLACFDRDCEFTDPTISFVGRDKFVSNVKNLKVLVDALTNPGDCRSDLLSIDATEHYVQTRWNMVGKLTGLPWQPTIDVIGRTKFWFRQSRDNDDGYQVYLYDECWEMPASKALLQLVTPSKSNGTD